MGFVGLPAFFSRGLDDGGACNSWGLDLDLKLQDVFSFGLDSLQANFWQFYRYNSYFFLFSKSHFLDLWKAMRWMLKTSLWLYYQVSRRKGKGWRMHISTARLSNGLCRVGLHRWENESCFATWGVPCEVCLSLLFLIFCFKWIPCYLCFLPVSLLFGLFAWVFCVSEGLCPNEQHHSTPPSVRPWSPYAGPLQKYKWHQCNCRAAHWGYWRWFRRTVFWLFETKRSSVRWKNEWAWTKMNEDESIYINMNMNETCIIWTSDIISALFQKACFFFFSLRLIPVAEELKQRPQAFNVALVATNMCGTFVS